MYFDKNYCNQYFYYFVFHFIARILLSLSSKHRGDDSHIHTN